MPSANIKTAIHLPGIKIVMHSRETKTQYKIGEITFSKKTGLLHRNPGVLCCKISGETEVTGRDEILEEIEAILPKLDTQSLGKTLINLHSYCVGQNKRGKK